MDMRRDRNGLHLEIADNGIGIDGLNRPNDIFKPFFRGHQSEEYDGVGLGLSFCAKLIESRRGTFEADCIAGGTRLHFFIPDEGLLMQGELCSA